MIIKQTIQSPAQTDISPSQTSFTDALASHILQDNQDDLIDINHICIFIPNALAAQQIRYSLVDLSQRTLLGGYIGNLNEWLNDYITLNHHTTKYLNPAARQLLLLEAIEQHTELFNTDNHWQVCISLLELFDELNLSCHEWLNESTPKWIEKLSAAYQANTDIAHLNQEAKIIQTLWYAWQQQLEAMDYQDDSGYHKQRLLIDIPKALKNKHFYIIGYEQLNALEQAWCEKLSDTCKVTRIIHGSTSDNIKDSSHYDIHLLNEIYSQTSSLFDRCKKDRSTRGFLKNIKCFASHSSEQEARAIDLKIRKSLLEKQSNVVVVTENRKLARRIQALLSRSNIKIQDTAGWTLATTSAATILERWAQCIEQDFAYQPLLDLLKSPFFYPAENAEEHLALIYRFEQDIIRHENIANNLQRFKNATINRCERLNQSNISLSTELISLIENIEKASNELTKLFHANKKISPDIWISHFINSIKELGLYHQLEADHAGQCVIDALKNLTYAHQAAKPEMSWLDFRTWLDYTFEREQFKPLEENSIVKIINMQQAQYCQFDTLIIAGANNDSFPGKSSQHPFFNQSVRQALQLNNWHDKKENDFNQFKQLLLSANDILITWQAEKNGEWMQVSPWVNSLLDFSQQCFNVSLIDNELEIILKHLNPLTQRSENLINKITTVSQAQPTVENLKLIPVEFSASRHQRLINCPYQFFVADILKLKPLEQISLELLKSEYGEKVHLILHAFHQQCHGLLAPFPTALSTANKVEALTHIEKLSMQVFNTLAEDSVQHRGWFARWMDTAESYINWQIERQMEWQISELETTSTYILNDDIKLTGRFDRIDRQDQNYAIIDYKTGNTARQSDIDLAENIQLVSYASLLNNVTQAIYLKLDKGKTQESGALENNELLNIQSDTLQRLKTIVSAIKTAYPLTAWGDSQTCNYCDSSGLCRKQMWEILS